MVLKRIAVSILCLYAVGCTGGDSVRVCPGVDPDAGAPSYTFGDYIDREERVLAQWRLVRIEATNAEFRSPHNSRRLLADHGLKPNILRDREPDDESWSMLADWADRRVVRDGLGVLSVCFPECPVFVDDAGELCIVSRRQVDRLAPPEYRDARTCERLIDDARELAELRCRLETERLTISETRGSLYDLVDIVQETAKLNIVIAAPVRRAGIPDRETSFSCTEERLGEALSRLVCEYSLDVTCENRVILIVARDGDRPVSMTTDLWSRRVRVRGNDLAMRDVARQIGESLGMKVVIDPTTWRRAASFDFDDRERQLGEVIEILRQGAPLQLNRFDDRLWFLAPPMSR